LTNLVVMEAVMLAPVDSLGRRRRKFRRRHWYSWQVMFAIWVILNANLCWVSRF